MKYLLKIACVLLVFQASAQVEFEGGAGAGIRKNYPAVNKIGTYQGQEIVVSKAGKSAGMHAHAYFRINLVPIHVFVQPDLTFAFSQSGVNFSTSVYGAQTYKITDSKAQFSMLFGGKFYDRVSVFVGPGIMYNIGSTVNGVNAIENQPEEYSLGAVGGFAYERGHLSLGVRFEMMLDGYGNTEIKLADYSTVEIVNRYAELGLFVTYRIGQFNLRKHRIIRHK